MGFTNLYLYNFRNYEILNINIDFPEVYFVGNNGQGKTNLLESLYYLCYGSSFRTKNEKNILRHDEDQMAAKARFLDKNNNNNEITIQINKSSKKIILNNKIINDRRDIISNMPCIVFCHGDLDFVIGNPDKKRLFFDQTLSLLNHNYVEIIRRYRNILKNKNKLLKTDPDVNLIRIYNKQLIDTGIEIQKLRESIIIDFNKVIGTLFNKISDLKGTLMLEYCRSWKNLDSDYLNNFLEEKINYEIKMKTSCYGPHRDNFKYKFNNLVFNDVASTGQLRLLSLILRASQGIFYKNKTKRKPILLLDDVLLELDSEKRILFMDNLPEYDQAFFTFLPDSNLIKNGNGIVMHIENGKII